MGWGWVLPSSFGRPVRGATIPDTAARRTLIDRVLSGVEAWESRWGPLPDTHLPDGLDGLLDEYAARMDATLPFFHPRYAGQMLKAPPPVAGAGSLAAMIVNPNNHALDASQATSPMEFEVVRMLADMFSLPERAIGHLTSSGTIGLGAIDDVHEALDLRERYDVRLHVDAAYGGFFALLGGPAYAAIASCDSVVVDPHKHGLQPYGYGAMLFADPSVARFYLHDSPYTYFTSEELHLGEISLECSRAGAAAGALWLTLKALPLRAGDGLGPMLAAGLRAARDWAARIAASEELVLYQQPELDILAFWAPPATPSCAAVDAASAGLLRTAMDDR